LLPRSRHRLDRAKWLEYARGAYAVPANPLPPRVRTRRPSDLLTKDYKVDKSTVEVKSKTSNGVAFTSTGNKSADGKPSGSLAAKYEFAGGITSEMTLNTGGSVEASLEGSPMKDLTVTLDCTRPAPPATGLLSAAKCTLDYKKESFTAKAAYDFYPGVLACAGSYVYDVFTLGCSADYSSTKAKLTKYGAACQFVQPDFSIIAKYGGAAGKPATYTGMYYHKVSSDMQIGAELAHTKGTDPSTDLKLAFGCMYKLDKDTTAKAKVDADGNLYTSYKQKLSPLATMTLAAQIDTTHVTENKHKFGMVLNVTP